MSTDTYKDGYYHVDDDLKAYPEAWLYVVYSPRGKGKTYSLLKYDKDERLNEPLIYMKRTIEDVNLICSRNDYGFDPSPYVPINRDDNTNIKAVKIKDGIGAFYEFVEGEPQGLPISYILAMSAIKRFKGFDFSNAWAINLDEFIPQIGERCNPKEGELLLDLFMTVQRDRLRRGRPSLKLILFANAEEISTPITNTLEIVDIMANLNASGETHYYDEERQILIHHITEEEFPLTAEEKTGIYRGMKNTAWFAKSFEGYFANNDFSNVNHINLKKFKCLIHLHYKTHDYYIYLRPDDGQYYMCESKQKALFNYDLNKENDQKRFYVEQWLDLRDRCIESKMVFKKYSMYDLIINYRHFFKL